VHDVLFHGHDATVLLQLDAGPRVRARVPGPLTARPGDEVTVRVSGPALFFPGAPR
jgi:iron(III) transport system ATP-binding protein